MVRARPRPQLGLPAGLPDGAPLIGRLRLAAVALSLFWAPAGSAQETRGGPAGAFDFYVLALSWSPGFCELEGERKRRRQCEPGQDLGFTVHGLWPQFQRGYPSECGPVGRFPSRAALEEARGAFPDEGLARHQWRRHGTCSGHSPAAYFSDVRQARDAVRIPERFQSVPADFSVTPLDIERAFGDSNPGLRPDMMAVICRRGLLQEVRICFERDLRGFRRCPEVDRSGCGPGEIRVEATR
jgi:ribonuclease T2